MNTDLLIIIILLAINLLAALVYLVLHLRKDDRRRGIIAFFFMLVFPLVGVGVVLCGSLVNLILRKLRSDEFDAKNISFSTERIKLPQAADIPASLDTVSVEEALLVSNAADRRQSFINLLKGDDRNQLPFIRHAVENTDPEIAHYAASYISTASTDFKNEEKQRYEEMHAKSEPATILSYIAFVESMTNSNIFTNLEMDGYAKRLLEAAEALYDQEPDEFPDDALCDLIKTLERLGLDDEVETWVDRARKRCWDDLGCFKVCVSYYYAHNKTDELFALLDGTAGKPLVIDHGTLEMIRFVDARRQK